MEDFPSNELIITFSLFSFFVFYLQKWSKEFMGASQGFRIFLDFFMGISTIFGLFFLIYYGYKVEWTSPLILFAISIFIKGILIAIEVKLFFRIQYIVQYIGFISFIACPILAYRLLVISGLIS
tara:strand:+ start:261 stop:632 length:372 start_codon:yes stop_codon:yes gene_type:complete